MFAFERIAAAVVAVIWILCALENHVTTRRRLPVVRPAVGLRFGSKIITEADGVTLRPQYFLEKSPYGDYYLLVKRGPCRRRKYGVWEKTNLTILGSMGHFLKSLTKAQRAAFVEGHPQLKCY